MKFITIVRVYRRWCLAWRLRAESDVWRASFEKLVVSADAEILAYNEKVVNMSVQLVNGMKNPSQSMYIK